MLWGGVGLDPRLLAELCDRCPFLSDITLDGGADDASVLSVLEAQPHLPALTVTGCSASAVRGQFLAQLPAGLRQLSLDCRGLRWPMMTGLACCGQLRRLELRQCTSIEPGPLADGLAGCGRLERLRLSCRGGGAITACLSAARRAESAARAGPVRVSAAAGR